MVLGNEKKIGDPSTFTGWAIIILAAVVILALLIATAIHSYNNEHWISEILKENFAATIGLPLAGIASLCIVILLGISEGPIKFYGLGFKFEGASGPIILWCLCFFVIAFAIKLLWQGP